MAQRMYKTRVRVKTTIAIGENSVAVWRRLHILTRANESFGGQRIPRTSDGPFSAAKPINFYAFLTRPPRQ